MTLWQDLRYAVWMLRKTPGFTAVAVLCLAVGIGVNSTAFSFVDGMWMRPLPVERPNELMRVFAATDRDAFGELSYPEFEEFRDHAKTFAGLTVTQRRGPTLVGEGFAESTHSNVVSPEFFRVMGLRAQVGRFFTAEDAGGRPVVVMSYNLWQRRFGGDPGIVGKSVNLGRSYTVVGIAPKGFRGVEPFADSDFWIPMTCWPGGETERANHAQRGFAAYGRLRPGVTLANARAEIDGLEQRLAREYPQFHKGRRGTVYTDMQYRLRDGGGPAATTLGIVAVILLIACTNVANLLLARSAARAREIGIRVALGASRSRVAGQLLTESAVLALLGCAGGLILGGWLIQLLPSLMTAPGDVSSGLDFRLDGRVLGCSVAASLATVLIFGLFPALRASRTDVSSALKTGTGRARTAGGIRPRSLLVVSQVALSMILLTGAGLLIRAFLHSLHADLGFARKSVLVAEIDPPEGRARAREFYGQLLERMRALPGVRGATLATRPPLWNSEGGTAQKVEILERRGENPPRVKFNVVGNGYFQTLGIRFLRGRDFNDRDAWDAPGVMIVSETMARRFWPNEDPVGKFAHTESDPKETSRQIVGVVGDARIVRVDEAPEAYFYVPYAQQEREWTHVLVETAGDPLRLGGALRAEVAALDKTAPVLGLSTLGFVIRSNIYDQQVAAVGMAAMGGIALFLAAIGLYGVIAYATTQRTREIGIRLALGARPKDARRLVMVEGMRLAGIGTAIGFAGALTLTRWMGEALYGISPRDPAAFAGGAALMVAVAAAASYVPARRATKVDPLTAVRCE